VLTRLEILERIKLIGEEVQKSFSIAEAALLLALLDFPEKSLPFYYEELRLISSNMSKFSGGVDSVAELGEAVSKTLFKTHNYTGDRTSYDNAENANLIRVIDRKKGLPVALGILYIHAARSQGWNIWGINFPNHFILRLTKHGEHLWIDPFADGKILKYTDLKKIFQRINGTQVNLESSFIRAVSDREVLIRLQNNIKLRAQLQGDQRRVIDILETMVLLAPFHVDFAKEVALLEAIQGNYNSSLAHLSNCINHNPESHRIHELIEFREQLKYKLN